ncbi:MAG: 2'-5' RNA ligase family protein [Dehalococcoidia bacterium]
MPDLASSFEDAWARLRNLDALQLVGDAAEQEFAKGRAQALTFQIRIENPAARDYIKQAIEHLGSIPGVDPLPDWFWHVTIKMAGFQVIKRTNDDDVLREDVPRLAREAREIITTSPAFEARLGLPNAFASVVFVEVLDEGRMAALNRVLLDGVSGIARYPIDGDGYLPHVSIARFRSNEGLDELKSKLAELRAGEGGASFSVARVEFVKAWVSEDPPEFDVQATYQLKGVR